MSRIGRLPVDVPAGVKIEVKGMTIKVDGPKGKLEFTHRPEIGVAIEGAVVKVSRKNESKLAKSLHGLTRALIHNMLQGALKGYQEILDIVGVGWQAKKEGKNVSMQIGYCHTVDVAIPEGVNVNLPNPQRIEISGADKQKVGHLAAQIRSVRPPEPYKGKGIRYVGEHVARKAGKSFVGGGAGGGGAGGKK
ncbi:MAG: 50S ribosomal protein L6 [Planctomycetes bacterium]|nr:50S ribosomal protein L6 [Planctomycetota bacterium]